MAQHTRALPARVLVSGASGLVGTELVRRLTAEGVDVVRLVRRSPAGPDEAHWAPESGMLDWRVVDGVDAVVNLAGAPISRMPWTPGYRKTMIASRVESTRLLANAMGQAATPPRTFVSGSAYGYYGDQPGRRLTEASPQGDGFLAELAKRWEDAAAIAPEGTRIVTVRTGLVLGPAGFLPLLRGLTRAGLGAHIGTGGQHWPWISVQDEAAAIVHLLRSRLDGPVNLVGPTPATADQVLEAIAETTRAGLWLTAPEWAVRMLGEAGHDLLLASAKVIPERLIADGFVFEHPSVRDAVRAQQR